jgi:hypothetical protein
VSGGGGNGGGNGAGNGGGNGAGNGAGNGGGASPGASPSASPTDNTLPYLGPWIVNQTLGDSTMTGIVCRTTTPWSVSVKSSKIAFTIAFTPSGPAAGSFAYAYNIASAGESHAASGTYKITGPDTHGAASFTLSGKDHVVFKGVDGMIPVPGMPIKLIAMPDAPCP